MMTTKLFENGRSQAVRLPKECRFNGDEVAISKVGDAVILLPKENKWSGFLSSLDRHRSFGSGDSSFFPEMNQSV